MFAVYVFIDMYLFAYALCPSHACRCACLPLSLSHVQMCVSVCLGSRSLPSLAHTGANAPSGTNAPSGAVSATSLGAYADCNRQVNQDCSERE